MYTRPTCNNGLSTRFISIGCLLALLALSNSALSESGSRVTDGVGTTATNEHVEIGKRFATALNTKDMRSLSDLFDMDQFAHITAHAVVDSQSEINGFVKGFLATPKNKLLHRIFTALFNQQATAKYLRLLKDNRPLIRIDYASSGHEYIILHVNQAANNKLVVVDIFTLTSGKELSASIGAATQLILKPSESMLKRLFGRLDIDKNMLSKIKEIGKLKNSGRYKEAYSLMDSLPEDIKNKRVMIDVSIMLAQQISDDEYQKQLARLDKYFSNDPTTGFILIDHYYYTQQYAKMQAALDRLITLLGEDGALYNLKASTYLRTSDFDNARTYCIKAIQVEPQFEGTYWTLVSVFNKQEKYSEEIKTLSMLEKQFGYAFTEKSFDGNAFYNKFVRSSEFKAKYKSRGSIKHH